MSHQRNWLKNAIRIAVSHVTNSGQQQDLFMAINVLDEVAKELRTKAASRAMCNAISGLTFDEWRNRGYAVIRGQRHTGRREDGVCTFAPNQVTPVGGYTGNSTKWPVREEYAGWRDDFADDDIPF